MQFFRSLLISELTINSPELVVIIDEELVQSCLQSGRTEEGWALISISLANAMVIVFNDSVGDSSFEMRNNCYHQLPGRQRVYKSLNNIQLDYSTVYLLCCHGNGASTFNSPLHRIDALVLFPTLSLAKQHHHMQLKHPDNNVSKNV